MPQCTNSIISHVRTYTSTLHSRSYKCVYKDSELWAQPPQAQETDSGDVGAKDVIDLTHMLSSLS